MAVATADIQSIALRRLSPGRSLALGGGVAVVAFATLVLIALASLLSWH